MAGGLSRRWAVLCALAVLAVLAVAVALPLLLRRLQPVAQQEVRKQSSVARALAGVLLVDGHNDLANNLRVLVKNKISQLNFSSNLTSDPVWSCPDCHTDLPRLRAGHVGAQFWVAYVDCKSQNKDAVSNTLEQIDVIKRLIKKYSHDLIFADSVRGIKEAFEQKKIASLLAVEGGHSIDSRLPVLRLMYDLGVRYLTLTHTCSTPWADSSEEILPRPQGVSEYGKIIIKEMNRLGMMVDLSHVSAETMKSAIEVSKAPVIFSHSSAYALCNHSRNVPDEILKLIPQNKGIVMVTFFSDFLVCENEKRNATLEDVVDHINYIRNISGVDHVGIGGDYDGVSRTPRGLEDVSKYPNLFDRLAHSKPSEPTWSFEDLKKLAGLNFLRVFSEVEKRPAAVERERSDGEALRGVRQQVLHRQPRLVGAHALRCQLVPHLRKPTAPVTPRHSAEQHSSLYRNLALFLTS